MSYHFMNKRSCQVKRKGSTANIHLNGVYHEDLQVLTHPDLGLEYVEPRLGVFVFLCSRYRFNQAVRSLEESLSRTTS